jgi:histone-lysine N-methyltransferase SETMAR
VTTGTLPHSAYSPDLAPSDFHLFSSLKVYVGGKIFRADVKLQFLCNDHWTSTYELFERAIMRVPEKWRRCIEVQGEYAEK